MADHGAPIPPQQVVSAGGTAPFNGMAPPTVTAPAQAPTKPKQPPAPEPKDGRREIVETVVFVVVLVLLLKSFVAEAFVIPTGSMAESLWGYQKVVNCPKCGYEFPVNCSREVDPQDGFKQDTDRAICPNCRHDIHFATEGINPTWSSGDRVLVAKFMYDLLQRLPERHDVVVFKYPQAPQKGATPTNYIKRLVGLPGETIAIYAGNLYYLKGLDYAPSNDYTNRTLPERKEDLWRYEYTYVNDPEAVKLFNEYKFQIVRKPPKIMLAERRIVYDNDFQNPDRPRRWEAGNGWTAAGTGEPRSFVGVGPAAPDTAWLRYRHVLDRNGNPELITDFLGYNTYGAAPPQNWVNDLMLECEVTPAQAAGEIILELSRGVDRFQARFDLAAGTCTLERVTNGEIQKLDNKSVVLKIGSKNALRFANFDERLTVWVNGALPFDEGAGYSEPAQRGPTQNDLQPASIGVQGANVTVAHLKLWRDTYYTNDTGTSDARAHVVWSDPRDWKPLEDLPVKTMYVQPGHYLCMGDNSPESSDGRSWGLVPERLMLGRALAVYYPFYFPYWPLYSRANRIGAIK